MKILVVPREFVEKNLDYLKNKQVISIFSSKTASFKYFSPFKENLPNVLKLQFDDVEHKEVKYPDLILFKEEHAKKVKKFSDTLNPAEDLYIHCDAGISRSGAVGDVLNLYFNKFKEDNAEDDRFFREENSHIMPNALVKRLMMNEFFPDKIYGVNRLKANDEVWCILSPTKIELRHHLVLANVVEKAIFKGMDETSKFGFIELSPDKLEEYGRVSNVFIDDIFKNKIDALKKADELNEKEIESLKISLKELEKIQENIKNEMKK